MKKIALITGASGGIGAAVAREFARARFSVGLHYSSDQGSAQAIQHELRGFGIEAEVFQADLTKPGAAAVLVRKALKAFGRVDVLVNNAGSNPGGTDFQQLSEREWDRALRLNLAAPFFISREVFKAMKNSKGGRIINISSIAVKFGGSARSMHYAAAKAGLEALTVGLAKQGAAYNILVNAIRPGVIDTPFHDKFRKDMKARVAMIPLKRMGRPEDIARAALFLATEGGNFITGQVLPVTGGE